MRKLIFAILLLASATCLERAALAQNTCPYWFGNVEAGKNDACSFSSHYTVYQDFFGSPSTFFGRQRNVNDDQSNPKGAADTMLEIPVLQKPRMVFWVQPVQRMGGFKLFFEF